MKQKKKHTLIEYGQVVLIVISTMTGKPKTLGEDNKYLAKSQILELLI